MRRSPHRSVPRRACAPPLGDGRSRRCDLARMAGRLAGHHHPGGRGEFRGERLQPGEREAHRGRAMGSGPAKRRRKRIGNRRRSRCTLARRKASAGPATSSSSECGATTNSSSIGGMRWIIFGQDALAPRRNGYVRVRK
jgi:hypothetical protein